jgi:hypothetical protein
LLPQDLSTARSRCTGSVNRCVRSGHQ